MRSLLLAHGWGYDRTVWDAVADLLPDRQVFRIEAGYLGDAPDWPAVPEGTVLVGHSGGVLSLLQHGLPPGCAGLVSINGFTRFTASDGFAGVPERVVARMEQGFAVSPADVLRAFRARCGDGAAMPDEVAAASLAAGLQALRQEDVRDRLQGDLPVLALAARDDPIVLPAHARDCFGEHRLRWSESGGHMLPLSRPDWCAAMIGAFAC